MMKRFTTFLMIAVLSACNAKTTQTPTTSPITPSPLPSFTSPKPSSTPGFEVNVTTSGTILKDETWRGEIHITGDIQIANGATLTIEPGTTVYLAPNSDDRHQGPGFDDEYTRSHNDPVRLAQWSQNAILIDGRNGIIQAVGTSEQPITFRPEGNSTSPAQWDGVYIERGTIQHAIILYGGRTAIQILGDYGNIEISYNEVRYFHWAGIDAHTHDVWIHHNIIEGGGHQAVGIAEGSVVEHNTILRSQSCIGGGGQNTVIRNNIMIDCARGVQIYGGTSIEVTNNTIVRVAGPPEGWFYQNQLIYPAFDLGGGIELYAPMQVTFTNNLIVGPFTWGIGLHQQPSAGSVVDYNMLWKQPARYAGEGQSVAGSHNSNWDPLFADPVNGDFHLLDGSPAIDAGDPEILDADGSPSDLGAYGGTAFSATPVIRPTVVSALCTLLGNNPTTYVAIDQPVQLQWGWTANTAELIEEFLVNNMTVITLDGVKVENPIMGGIQPSGNHFAVTWTADVGILSPGSHTITYFLSFQSQISDGQDTYGPGGKYETLKDACKIIVQ